MPCVVLTSVTICGWLAAPALCTVMICLPPAVVVANWGDVVRRMVVGRPGVPDTWTVFPPEVPMIIMER